MKVILIRADRLSNQQRNPRIEAISCHHYMISHLMKKIMDNLNNINRLIKLFILSKMLMTMSSIKTLKRSIRTQFKIEIVNTRSVLFSLKKVILLSKVTLI